MFFPPFAILYVFRFRPLFVFALSMLEIIYIIKSSPCSSVGGINFVHYQKIMNGKNVHLHYCDKNYKLTKMIVKTSSIGSLLIPYQIGQEEEEKNGKCLGENGQWYSVNSIISVGKSFEGETVLVEYCGSNHLFHCSKALALGDVRKGYCHVYIINHRFFGISLSRAVALRSVPFTKYASRYYKDTLLEWILHYLQTPERVEYDATYNSKRSTICMFSSNCMYIRWY